MNDNETVIPEEVSDVPEASEAPAADAVQDEQTEAVSDAPITPEPPPEVVQDAQSEVETGQLIDQAGEETGESETEQSEGETAVTGEQSDTVIITERAVTEYVEMTAEPRPFLTTPFEEYTVTEGFLLLFFLMAVIAAIYSMVRRFTI